jgi:hypothetical protein
MKQTFYLRPELAWLEKLGLLLDLMIEYKLKGLGQHR